MLFSAQTLAFPPALSTTSKTARIMRALKMEVTVSTEDQLQKLREDVAARMNSRPPEDTSEDATPPPAPLKAKPPVTVTPHLPLPVGTQPMLDAQLGEALKIMRDYADWGHLPTAGIDDCIRVGDTLARMMTSSATLATVAARLQKGEPESVHRMIVQYAEPLVPEGEGSAKSRKRINRGNG